MTLPPAAKPLALQVVPDHQREGVLDRGHEIEVQEVLQEAEVPPASVLGKLVQRPFATPQGIASPSPASQLLALAFPREEAADHHQPCQLPLRFSGHQPPQVHHPPSSLQEAWMSLAPLRGGHRASHLLRPLSTALRDLPDLAACLHLVRPGAGARRIRSWGPATSTMRVDFTRSLGS